MVSGHWSKARVNVLCLQQSALHHVAVSPVLTGIKDLCLAERAEVSACPFGPEAVSGMGPAHRTPPTPLRRLGVLRQRPSLGLPGLGRCAHLL